jgi:3-oxoacyl-[acyl-carrier protein] reductase
MTTSSLKGRSAVVTGGSKGIGKGIARVFANAGAKVVIAARNLDQAAAAAKEIGHGAFGIAADVSKLNDMEAMAKTAADRNGGIDVLCANAGIFPQAKLEEMTSDQWDEVISTNLKGCFHSVKACVHYLKRSDQGRIVLTSSITGPVTGFPGWSHYGASKSGQLGFMHTASIELAKYGITVNAVMPGNIITEGLAEIGEDYHKTMAASIPLKRLGTVEDIASREAGYITGQTIIVDGGQILPESLEALAQA